MTSNIICFAFFAIVSMFFGAKRITGFTTELYHRDSFYDPSLSRTDIINRVIARGVISRTNNLVRPNGPVSDLSQRNFEYLMKFHLGTPGIDIVGIPDTGSDIIWTQCKSCTKCLRQNMPLYDPKASKSYVRMWCDKDSICPPRSFCGKDGLCQYEIHYIDGSYSKGIYSKDIMRIPNLNDVIKPYEVSLVFGCGIIQKGLMGTEGSGVIGLGPGSDSLVGQLGQTGMQRFSYCLVPVTQPGSTSSIHFGEDAEVSGDGTVTLSLFYSEIHRNYFATLKAFTIGTTLVEYKDVTLLEEVEGNIVIDSGTVLTYVPNMFYAKIVDTFSKEIRGAVIVPDPRNKLDFCIEINKGFQFPEIVAKFDEGDVALSSFNLFVEVAPDVHCLAMQPTDDYAILGCIAQGDFLIGFDHMKHTASIKHKLCSGSD